MGTDGTALFDQHHSWVNADGILAACCVGTLAQPSPPPSPPPPSTPDAVSTDAVGQARPSEQPEERAVEGGRAKRVKWDEQGIQAHDAQRGVMFGAPATPPASPRRLRSTDMWPELPGFLSSPLQAL